MLPIQKGSPIALTRIGKSYVKLFSDYIRSKTNLIFWLIIGGSVMTFFVCDSCSGSLPWYVKVSTFTASIWISMWIGNEFISQLLDTKISWTKEPLKRFAAGIAGMLLYTVTMVFFLVTLFQKTLGVDVGDVIGMLYGTVIVTFFITLFMTSRSFLFNWKRAAIDTERLKKESVVAQYESLKSQVNPHFLFNSLNALTNLVYEDQDKAAKFIKQLSDVYRYVLDTRDREMVSLEEELRFLNSYLFLQQIRFGDKLHIKIELSGIESQVAPLAFQMLIENAIKHNVISQDDPLMIRLYSANDYLVIENLFQKRSVLKEDSPGIGLDNIRKRYAFLSERPIEVIQTEKLFSVKLPILKLEQV